MELPRPPHLIGVERKRVLVTVKAYPLPSRSYGELVCTAGVLKGGSWIRIYPVPFRFLRDDKYVAKYQWIELDLKRNPDDFRPESHRPVSSSLDDMVVLDKVGTEKVWATRRGYCCANVYTSKRKLIEDAYGDRCVSLATFKPAEITGFVIQKAEREWKDAWKAQLRQLDMFAPSSFTGTRRRTIIPKLPYKFSYRFLDDDGEEATLMIEDWEIGALYWNCLRGAEGDEEVALEKVREKYWSAFREKDIHLFLGTTLRYHRRGAPNPFVIVGVFYPPAEPPPPGRPQLSLFE